ncbi:MAG: hypothetical protein U0797_02000 [Gemmataceae bacterium]
MCPDASPAMEADAVPEAEPRQAAAGRGRGLPAALQEVGKAGGILLLPPGSLDKLIAARKANEPTVTYVPRATAGEARRVLLGAGGLLGLLALAALAKGLWPVSPGYVGGPERLHDLRVGGDSKRLPSLTMGRNNKATFKPATGNPWELAQTRSLMSPALRPEDLGLPRNKLNELVVHYTIDDRIVAIADGEVLLGILSRDPEAKSEGGVGIGTTVREVERRYKGQELMIDSSAMHAGQGVEVYRYPYLGLSFEVRSGSVSAIALYPPRE